MPSVHGTHAYSSAFVSRVGKCASFPFYFFKGCKSADDFLDLQQQPDGKWPIMGFLGAFRGFQSGLQGLFSPLPGSIWGPAELPRVTRQAKQAFQPEQNLFHG